MYMYTFMVAVRKSFKSYEEYLKYRTKVDLAITMLGFRSHSQFLNAIYDMLYTMVNDDDLASPEKKIKLLLEALNRRVASK